jgi:hypothetical protein
MRSVLTPLAVLACAALCQAQDPVMQVATWGFSHGPNADADDVREAAMLTSITTELLSRNSRIAVINRTIDEVVDKERNEQMNAEYIRGKIAKQGMASGGTQQLAGFLNSCNVVEQSNTGKYGTTTSYNASVTFEISMVDQSTGQNIGRSLSKTVTGSSGLFGGVGPDGALENANRRAKRLIANWLMTVLPSDLKVLKVADSTGKGIPTRLLVKGGQDIGMTKGEDLLIVEIEMLDGTPVENTIAELNVTEVKATSSECKIRKGGDDYKAKRDAKADMKILFKPDKE